MKKNAFIYLTAFVCGMSVMAVELSATRLLAPYFSTSMIVWTVVIGLIMISLSVGNILGGRLADKYNSMGRLYSYIWIAAIWIAIIPLTGKYIISAVSVVLMLILPNNLIVIGSVISCLVIFSLPLIILGMVSPYLVKLGVKDMENNGRTTGEIYALSTIGSIIGTFIPTFLTIPLIGTNKTFFVFALTLNLLCLYYFITARLRKARTAISALVIAVLIAIPFNNSYAFWEKSVIYEGESLYNYLQVKEDNGSIILSTNVAFGVQSIYRKNSILSGYYFEYALMAPLFIKDMDFDKKLDILILGFATGTYAKQCKYFFPDSRTDGVEIDSKIIDLAKKYFDFKDEEANVYINDGRTFFLSSDAKKYDLILVDAYHDITIPFHMATKEFFEIAKSHLNKGGVLMLNVNIHSKKDTGLMDYITNTIKSVMKKAYTCDIKNVTNTIVISSDDEDSLTNYSDNIKKIGRDHLLYDISRYVGNNLKEVTQSKYILTDDLAPVEIMGQKVLDEVVDESISDIKAQIDSSGKGIWGIFDIISGQ